MKMKKLFLVGQEFVISLKKSFLSYYYFLFMVHGYLFLASVNATILKRRTGQSVLEYFLLFMVIIVLTVIGISTFFPRIQDTFNNVQNAAIERILNADGNY